MVTSQSASARSQPYSSCFRGPRGGPFAPYVGGGEYAIFPAWSNGQTEGWICKHKLVKRHIYGRGELDLVEARVIGSPKP